MSVAANIRRLLIEAAELPGLNLLMRPVYNRVFARNRYLNLYRGVFSSYAEAQSTAPTSRPVGYDNNASAGLYRDRVKHLRSSDFPGLFWVARLFEDGSRRVFDLGGHFGVTYYALRHRAKLPAELDWCISDVPAVTASGREYATEHDPEGRLRFTERPEDCDGSDVLLACGSLQYLDYTLADLLRRLNKMPRHLVISQIPLHPSKSFFTLQSMGTAFCAYRVSAEPEFVESLQQLGFELVDRWESLEKRCRIPFKPGYSVDRYLGFVFSRKTE